MKNKRKRSASKRAIIRRAVDDYELTIQQMEYDKIYELSQTLHMRESAVRRIWEET